MEIKLLSVIVPVYKQEKTVKEDLENIYNTLKQTPYNFEILGVVDGTQLDNTYTKAKELQKSEIKIYGYKKNHGKGQAVRYGMKLAKGNVITFIDGGGDINPQSIIMLLEHMKWYKADIIVGSKLHSASIVENYSLIRRIFTRGYYYIVKILFRLNIRDTQTGLKAYKREVLESVLDKLVVKRFCFDIEVLAVANRLGFKKMYDAPVQIDFGKIKSTVVNFSIIKTIIRFLYDTFAIWYRMYILKYYDDGRKRRKIYDKDLQMWVNTGEMAGKRQILIDTVNRFFDILGVHYNKK